MVIDTSAILALLFDKPEADAFARLVKADPAVLISAVSRVETTFVIEGRKGDADRVRLDRFFALAGAEVVPMSQSKKPLAQPIISLTASRTPW